MLAPRCASGSATPSRPHSSDGTRCSWRLPILFGFLLAGCAPAETWSQFHGDAPSQNFSFVGTGYAVMPAWGLAVGPVYYSSPVIGPDGAIHVGNLDGDIIALRPDGTEKWRITTPFRIFGSPAVANDGTVYAVLNGFSPTNPASFAAICSRSARTALRSS